MTSKNLLNIFGTLTFILTLIYLFPLQRTLDYCAFRLFKPEKISLGFFPTPLHKIDSVKKIYNGPSVYIKRDDLTGLAFGGNKVRKLEYACAQALKEGATMLVTTGPFHSNHCRQTAAAAAHLGLDCTLLLRTPDTQIDNDAYQTVQGNLLLDNLLHAHIVNKDNPENPQSPEELAQLLTEQGHRAYSIPTGASNEIGSIGYIDAFFEIMDQQKKTAHKLHAHSMRFWIRRNSSRISDWGISFWVYWKNHRNFCRYRA
ncbi:pyridoxal-phosphate dependent enzyme [bacterium]|nr:pyridoxal-phosphate dependent enzyme [bacterium]